MFSRDTYVSRRKRLLEDVNAGIAVFLGNEESPMNYADNTFPFRQDSSFLYFFGLDYAGLAAVIDLDDGSETVFGDELTIDHIVWMGTQPTLKEKSLQVGVKNTAPFAHLEKVIKTALAAGRTVHFLPPYRPDNMIRLSKWTGIDPYELKENSSLELVQAVIKQRNIKSEEEIAEIEKAVNVTADMHLTAMKMARPGMTEVEIAGVIEGIAVSAGGRLSFPAIVTKNGQTLHNHYHGHVLQSGDLVLNDSGAETAMRYAGDMSRTFPVDPVFTERQKEIYNIALAAHEAAVAALKPGIPFKEVHLTACRTIATGLKEMGFMKGDVDEAVAQGAHALFFPCGTGHMMGLDVHDMEDLGEQWVGYDGEPKSTLFGLKSLRLARPLEPGFVLTIEPGIYFIPELIDLWKREKRFADFINYDKVDTYRDFSGLRSEEDFVITDTGARLLGKPVPKTIQEIESVRAE